MTDHLSAEDLAELERLLEQAGHAKAGWVLSGNDFGTEWSGDREASGFPIDDREFVGHAASEADAALIVAAVNALPRLLAMIKEQGQRTSPVDAYVKGRADEQAERDDRGNLAAEYKRRADQAEAEVDQLREAIAGSPEKAKRLASLVQHSTRLVQIERDDARAEVERLRGVVNTFKDAIGDRDDTIKEQREAIEIWADLHRQARQSLDACADRIDEHTYSELSAHLHDGPMDPEDGREYRSEVERLRALAGHLFDGESLSTREAIRSELITQGFEDSAEVERLRREQLEFSSALGFGDGVHEPAATLKDMLDPIEEAFAAARDHNECAVVCELCGERLASAVCEHCHGSGCLPNPALAYQECGWCGGAGRIHVGCAEQSYGDLAAEVERLRATVDRVEKLADGWDAVLEPCGETLRSALIGDDNGDGPTS